MKNKILSIFGLILTLAAFLHSHEAGATVSTAMAIPTAVRSMENYAFDTYDPDFYDPETYDPNSEMYDDEGEGYDLSDSYAPSRRKMANAKLAQLDIVIDNTAISATTTVELFNYLRSNTTIRNTTYNATTFEPYVFDKTFLRATPASGQLLSDAQLIYWRSDGSLVYNTTAGTGSTAGAVACIISCPQVPFRVLHEATRNNLLYIEKARLSVKTSAQIDQPINVFKNSFLGGTKTNQIAPRAEFRPNQFQSLIVDVPMKLSVDAETGFSYTLISQEKVTMTLFFKFLRGNESSIR